jgi:hypothetical protein
VRNVSLAAGCATREVVILDLTTKELTHDAKAIEPWDLFALADARTYGQVDLIVRSEKGIEKKDLKKEVEELGLLGLVFLQLAVDKSHTNATNSSQNQVPEDTPRKLGDPQH